MKAIAYELMAACEESHWWYRARSEIVCDIIARLPRGSDVIDFRAGAGAAAALLSPSPSICGGTPGAGLERPIRRAGFETVWRSYFNTLLLPAIIVFAFAFWPVSEATAETPTGKIVKAANAFLGTLDQKQRPTVLFAFNDERQRARWSNLPIGAVSRGGIVIAGGNRGADGGIHASAKQDHGTGFGSSRHERRD